MTTCTPQRNILSQKYMCNCLKLFEKVKHAQTVISLMHSADEI